MIRNVLEISGLTKSYAEWGSEWLRFASWLGVPTSPRSAKTVLEGVDLKVGRGESIGIVGRNGAGKSTLLKIITGTLAPSSGSVGVYGSVASILELGMGFQPELTGRENAYQISGLMGHGRVEVDSVIDGISRFADIGDAFDHPVRTYSSGMQARVAFAIATAFRPDLLIVDEALAVGDALFQVKCYERIRNYREQGMSVLLVSHSVADIVRNCDRAILLSDGRVRLDGHPRDVTNIYLEEMFGSRRVSPSSPESDGMAHHAGTGSTELASMLNGKYEDRPGYRADEHRWGNGLAEITDYRISAAGYDYPAILECGSIVKVAYRCLFRRSFHNVVPGIMIRAVDGVFIYGTNSLILNSGWQGISVEEGDVRVFEFTFALPLNSGDYLLSLGVASGEAMESLEPLDRRYDSIVLSSTRSVPFTGLVDLDAELMVYQ